MGASFDSETILDYKTKPEIETKWRELIDADGYANGHSYSGTIAMLDGKINWIKEKFLTEDEASDYIQDKHDKFGGPMCVFFEASRNNKTKRLDKKLSGCVIGGWCAE